MFCYLAWSPADESRSDRQSATTKGGLTLQSELDESSYPTGQPVTDRQMATLSLKKDNFHGDLSFLAKMNNLFWREPLVITSPPYLNAIDYLRCSKFSLVWMGYSVGELRRLRSATLGTEVGMDARDNQEVQRILSELKLQPKLPARQEAMLARYINDMQRTVGETSRVLADNGRAVYVVGENTVRGTFIPNAMIVEAVAGIAGFRCIARRSRELPANRRYLPPPSKQSETATLGNRLRREVILTFQKMA